MLQITFRYARVVTLVLVQDGDKAVFGPQESEPNASHMQSDSLLSFDM